MPFPRHSMSGWGLQRQRVALRIWAVSAAWVFVPGRYACPGWEWVPSIAIAWGRMLAGCALHVLDEFRGGIPACNEREQTI